VSARVAAQYAGCRQATRARSTGTLVLVLDAGPAGLDPDGGRWNTVCDDHGSVCSHQTLALARYFASAPEEWCEDCRTPGSMHPYDTDDCTSDENCDHPTHYTGCPNEQEN
jgi:hypothetical protein